MAVELVMPRLSESMEEGTVVSWLVPDGTPVYAGQEIAEIETDKATVPYEAPESGVLRILVGEGSTLALGQPIGLIDDLAPLPGGQFAPPPSSQSPATAWSPAWGPQPIVRAESALMDHDAEGETTEFAVIDPGCEPAGPVAAAPQPAPSPSVPTAPGTDPPVSADERAMHGQPVVAPAPRPAAAAPTPQPSQPPLPWVDPSFSPKVPRPDASAAPGAVPTPTPTRASPPGTTPPAADVRLAPQDHVTPRTLPPRPPELRPASGAGGRRIAASPVARRLARELGIDLTTITGTGPEGRVVRADIEAAQATGAARPPKQAGATAVVASEFTPPVDEDRAAAPIPDVEPGEPEPGEIPVGEPLAAVSDPELAPGEVFGTANEAPDEAVGDDGPSAPADALRDPDATALTVAAALATETGGELADAGTPAQPGAHTIEVESDLPDAATPSVIPDVTTPASNAATEPTTPDANAATEPTPFDTPTTPTETTAAPTPRGKGDPVIVELTRQQQTVARRMAESKGTIPDFHTAVEVDAGPLVALRSELRTNRPDLTAPSINDWLIKATAVALRAFPSLNGGYRDGRIEHYPKVNIGIAVDADGTLLVPVVHEADQLAISQIGARTGELVAKARSGGLRPPDIASATFTLSNLGSLGVDQFTAVITPGQSAILTAGRIAERPVARDGQVVAAPTLILTLTTDHRAVYGAEAARFLGRLKQLLEHPSSLLA